MTRSLNDCHTFFLPPQRADVLTDLLTGRASGGVGIELAPVKPSYVRETIGESEGAVNARLPLLFQPRLGHAKNVERIFKRDPGLPLAQLGR